MSNNSVVRIGCVYYPYDFTEGLKITIIAVFRRNGIHFKEVIALREGLVGNTFGSLNINCRTKGILRIEYGFTARNGIEARNAALFVKRAIQKIMGARTVLIHCNTVESENCAVNRIIERLVA